MAVDGDLAPAAWRAPERVRAESTVEAAYVAHYQALARYACWLVGDSHLAADLVQEAFARLAARWIGVREPRAYLFQIITNLAHTEWRRLRRERDNPVEVEPDLDPANAVAVRDAVYRLPRNDREVVWLHYWADLPIADIARVTGRPEGTVKSQLFNARRRLARALEGQDGRS